MAAVPVERLPSGPVTTVLTQPGALVAAGLPRQEESSGLVWRVAREVDRRVVRQVAEGEVGGGVVVVVVVFEVVGKGETSIVFALTRGESSPHALEALTYRVEVT